MALFHFLAQLAADLRSGLALLVGRRRLQGRDGRRPAFLIHGHHGEEAAVGVAHAALGMSSATTLMPISIDEVPVWFTEARKVTSSPTAMGWRNITCPPTG
jgi:hypothetical protein